MRQTRRPDAIGIASSTFLAAVVLGGVGFVCGFFGPGYIGGMVGVDMTLGPLLGFFMGPAGFCLGALVGFVCALVRLGPGSFLAVLGFSALGVAVVTLYASIPDPKYGYKGTIIDAQIQGCGSIGDHWDLAMAAM